MLSENALHIFEGALMELVCVPESPFFDIWIMADQCTAEERSLHGTSACKCGDAKQLLHK